MPTQKNLSVAEAVHALQAGQVVIYPTETFYAIGCDVFNAKAVSEVFRIKQRSAHFPLPLIVPGIDFIGLLASGVTATAEKLMQLFWPGPLTLLLPARKDLPAYIASGSEFVAVRVSSHSIASQLAEESKTVLTASSANISGFPPVWHPDDIDASLAADCYGIVAEEPFPKGGAPSTIIRIDNVGGQEKLYIRRAGAISKKCLEDAGFSVI